MGRDRTRGSRGPERGATRIRSLAGLRGLLSLTTAAVLLAGGCATNPATGQTQLSLISRSQEIQMGRQASQQVEATIGTYGDSSLVRYIRGVGMGIARVSERPDLPWSYEIADEPVVNAFALPGGFIYVTRGILPYFNSEAELAAVLGHETGHVTARHSVEQISRQQLAQLGLGIGSVLFEPVQKYGNVLGAGLNLLFLKYSRDDERQADALGLRYMVKAGYDPNQMIDVFQMLDRQSSESGGSGVPGWLQTHPSPQDRIQLIRKQLDTLPVAERKGKIERQAYLKHMDGIVFGQDPRDGYFQGDLFLHPKLRFQIRFPQGWQTQNTPQAVSAGAPNGDAVLQLTLAQASGHRSAASDFFSQQGVRSGGTQETSINGFPATLGSFEAQTQSGVVDGLAAFLDFGGNTYQILGYAAQGSYGSYRPTFESAIRSFDRLTDRSALDVQPMRVELYTTRRQTSIREIARSKPSPVSVTTLAIVNGVREDEAIPRGRTIKWVVGQKPPGSGS